MSHLITEATALTKFVREPSEDVPFDLERCRDALLCVVTVIRKEILSCLPRDSAAYEQVVEETRNLTVAMSVFMDKAMPAPKTGNDDDDESTQDTDSSHSVATEDDDEEEDDDDEEEDDDSLASSTAGLEVQSERDIAVLRQSLDSSVQRTLLGGEWDERVI
tara:strand:+ start:37 stop:522 length:486 start_codon:yes stop_codon:yes gene_type:complete